MLYFYIVFGYDKAFKAHLKVYTNEELINILQDDDKTINAINDVDIILKKVASTNGHNILDSKYLDSILRLKKIYNPITWNNTNTFSIDIQNFSKN